MYTDPACQCRITVLCVVLREKPAQPPLTTRSLDYLGFWVLESAASAFFVLEDDLVWRGEKVVLVIDPS